jgi:hypothetical protein
MNDDDYIADVFHGMIAGVQESAIAEADKVRAAEREEARTRRQASNQGLNASELLQELSGDSEEKKMTKLQAEMDRINKDAADAAKAKENADEQLPADRFPPPTLG